MTPIPRTPDEPTSATWMSPMARDADTAAAVRDAATTVPGVAALYAGEFGQVGTFAGERAILGVRVDDEQVQVHIVARYGIPLSDTAAGIGAVVAPLLAGRSLRIAVQDILLPGEQLAEAATDPTSVPSAR